MSIPGIVYTVYILLQAVYCFSVEEYFSPWRGMSSCAVRVYIPCTPFLRQESSYCIVTPWGPVCFNPTNDQYGLVKHLGRARSCTRIAVLRSCLSLLSLSRSLAVALSAALMPLPLCRSRSLARALSRSLSEKTLQTQQNQNKRQVGVPNFDGGERGEGADEGPRSAHFGDGAGIRPDRVRVRADQALEPENAGRNRCHC